MIRSLAAGLAATAALAGCGGGGSDRGGGPRATLQRYFAAIADRRGAAACAELTDRSRELIAEAGRALPGKPSSCPGAMEALFRSRFGGRLAALRHPRITSLTVRGNRATAHVDGVDAPLQLSHVSGAWRIEFTPSVETD